MTADSRSGSGPETAANFGAGIFDAGQLRQRATCLALATAGPDTSTTLHEAMEQTGKRTEGVFKMTKWNHIGIDTRARAGITVHARGWTPLP